MIMWWLQTLALCLGIDGAYIVVDERGWQWTRATLESRMAAGE